MSFADGVIIVVVSLIVAFVLYNQLKKKDEGVCTKCSYAKQCSKDDCFPSKKSSDIE
ncbi:MAG: FeoB-associated Cys-rich membrane protein [Acholeplasmataceae bacterium]|nr:FeoB-associated Cys-rich membrane protein [Acholeplasmataceae bacterium]